MKTMVNKNIRLFLTLTLSNIRINLVIDKFIIAYIENWDIVNIIARAIDYLVNRKS